MKEFGQEQEAQNIYILIISRYIQNCNQIKARDTINEFRIQFPNSHHKDEIDQLELESYFYKQNFETTISDIKKSSNQYLYNKLEDDLIYYTKRWINENHISWFAKNVGFLLQLYESTDRRQKAYEVIDDLFNFTKSNYEARKRLFNKVFLFFEYIGDKNKLKEITKIMIDSENNEIEKQNLENKYILIDQINVSSQINKKGYKDSEN